MNQGLFSKLEEYTQEIAIPLENRLKEIEKTINQLGEVKEQLQNIFNTQIAAKLEEFKNMMQMVSQQEKDLQKDVENIESNISDLI